MITKNGYGYEEYEKELNWAAEYAKRELRKHREAVPIDHADESVTTAKLADGSVTYDKLGEDVQNELTELENEINTHEETVASQTVSGHVTLSDEANMNVGAEDGVAATPKAVYNAYEEVQTEVNSINQELNTHESTKATESVLGHVYITDTASASMPADTGKAASSYAVAYAVSNERTERQVADERLQASIYTEAQTRADADEALQASIDVIDEFDYMLIKALVYVFSSSANNYTKIQDMVDSWDGGAGAALTIIQNGTYPTPTIIQNKSYTPSNIKIWWIWNSSGEDISTVDWIPTGYTYTFSFDATIEAGKMYICYVSDVVESSTSGTANMMVIDEVVLNDSIDTIQGQINSLVSADAALQTNIDTEASARKSADTTLQTNIDTEAEARESADTALQEQIINTAFGSDTQVGVDLDNIRENGAYYVLLPSSKLDGGEHHYPLYDEDSGEYENYGMLLVFDDSLENGSVIQMYIPCSSASNLNINRFYIRKVVYRSTDGEVISRTDWVKFSSLGVIQELIDAEASAREAADATLQTNINTEATARKSADTTLQSNIDAEAAARKSADSAISADIEALQKLSHTHDNKSVLDSITGERVEIWDSNVDFAEYKEYANEIFAGMMRELQNLYAAIGVTLFDGGLFGEEYLGASLDGGYFTDTDLVDFDCGGFDVIAVSTAASVDGGTY